MDKANQGAPAARNTPGPWRLERSATGRFTVRGAHGGRVEVLSLNIRDEDAKLIAAAPALADALDRVRAYFDEATTRREALGVLLLDVSAALRAAGREANNVSAAPAAPSNSKEQP